MQKRVVAVTVPGFQAVFQAFPAACILTGVNYPDFHILECNKACKELPGFSTAENLKLHEVFSPGDYSCSHSCISTYALAILEGRQAADQPLHYHRQQDGPGKSWELTFTPVNNEITAVPEYLLISMKAVTPGIPEQVAAYDQRLRTVYKLARMGYWSRVLGAEKADWSDEMYDLFGQSPAFFQPYIRDIIACFHPEDRQLMEVAPETLFPVTDYRDFEYRVITPSGKIRWLTERTTLIRDHSGKPHQLQGIVRDITDIKQASLALKKSNERYELVLRATNEAICDWNIELNKAVWDDSFQDIFGHDVRQYNNDVWSSNIHPDDRDWVLQVLQDALEDKDKELFFAEYRFFRADRSIAIIQHTGAVLRDNGGRATRSIGSLKDVTAYKEGLFRIQQQNQRLKEISWIQSHIVRAPLARLIGLTELLKSEAFEDFTASELQAHILSAAEELDQIIRNIIANTEKIEQD